MSALFGEPEEREQAASRLEELVRLGDLYKVQGDWKNARMYYEKILEETREVKELKGSPENLWVVRARFELAERERTGIPTLAAVPPPHGVTGVPTSEASAITAKVPASTSNTDGPPKDATKSPATAGPMTKERLRLNDQSIFAASKS